MKKYLTLALLVFGLPACGLLIDECGRDRSDTYYDVQGIEVGLARQPTDKPWEVVAAGATVASRELRLRLLLKERHYTSTPGQGFISAAYACSPTPAGSLGSAERMDSLNITSAYDYDATHPAGTPLTDLLETRDWAQMQFPSRQNPQEPFRYLDLNLKFPPAATGPQKFQVYYRQTNGEVYTAETAIITLSR